MSQMKRYFVQYRQTVVGGVFVEAESEQAAMAQVDSELIFNEGEIEFDNVEILTVDDTGEIVDEEREDEADE